MGLIALMISGSSVPTPDSGCKRLRSFHTPAGVGSCQFHSQREVHSISTPLLANAQPAPARAIRGIAKLTGQKLVESQDEYL